METKFFQKKEASEALGINGRRFKYICDLINLKPPKNSKSYPWQTIVKVAIAEILLNWKFKVSEILDCFEKVEKDYTYFFTQTIEKRKRKRINDLLFFYVIQPFSKHKLSMIASFEDFPKKGEQLEITEDEGKTIISTYTLDITRIKELVFERLSL